MRLRAEELYSVTQTELLDLGLQGLPQRAVAENLDPEAPATPAKNVGGRDQVAQPLLLDQPRHGQDDRWLRSGHPRPRERELGEIEAMIDTMQFAIGRRADLTCEMLPVILRAGDHGLSPLGLSAKKL